MTSNWIEVKTDQGEQWSRDIKRGALPRHCLLNIKLMRNYLIKVSPVALRSELAKRNINTDVLATLCGLSGRSKINHMLAKGGVTQEVSDVLHKLSIPH